MKDNKMIPHIVFMLKQFYPLPLSLMGGEAEQKVHIFI